MHELARRLLKTIRKQQLLRAGDRVAAAVSGGADSVALLYLLEELRSELGIVLSVAHVNHKLRGEESEEDERFVTRLAARLGLELDISAAPLVSKAIGRDADAKSGIEAEARKLRYRFFRELAERGRVTKVVTAHTLDDQAETLLLRIFRGTGIRGLAAIHPRVRAGREKNGGASAEVVRPLLTFRREELRDYLQGRAETWREDSSNNDLAFLRNRVRHRLLPLITQEFGAAALRRMAELAEIARAEDEYWSAGRSKDSKADILPAAAIPLTELLSHPLAVQRRLVRTWLEANVPDASISFALIEEILELAIGPAGRKLELPGGPSPRSVRRSRNELALECRAAANLTGYEYALPVPGDVTIPELSARIEAQLVNVESIREPERSVLLDPDSLGHTLTIRNWRAGDRYWPAHTASEKKVKDLLADRHATGAKKKLWPVATTKEGGLVWMRGFAAPVSFRPRTARAIWICEILPKP